MDSNFRIWLIVVSLALISSVVVQIILMFIFVRLLALVRPVTGSGPGLREIFDKVLQAATAVDRAARAAGDTLEQISLQVHHVANISEKRLADADRVAGEVLTTVERINHNVGAVTGWPFREAMALSAGLRTGATALFTRRHRSTEGRQE